LRPDRFGIHIWLFVVIGTALAMGGVCLAIFLPGTVPPFLVLLPRIYASTLAGSCFWFRAKNTADREGTFWRLWAWGCWLWTITGVISLVSRSTSPIPTVKLFSAALTFIPQVLFMAGLVMQPEISEGRLRDPVVRYEAALVALWWTYLYILILIPWHWVLPDARQYLAALGGLHDFQYASMAVWMVALALSTQGGWRRVYCNLTGAIALFAVSMGFFYQAWDSQRWLPTMLFQALLAAAFLWMSQCALIPTAARPDEPVRRQEPTLGAGAWLASITAIGIPALALWSRFLSAAPEPVRHFRLFVSFTTLVVAVLILYRWQDVAESQRERLVGELGTSVQELRQLQGHFAETEKLVSLGQLAAGAAHEINNPVAAMLGYSELLRSDPSASGRVLEFGGKIGDQTRRIRSLVHNLLSLAEGERRESELVDVSTPLHGALELRRISIGQRKQNLSLVTDDGAPLQVWGDPEKLLQVFYRLFLNLSEGGETDIEVRVRNDDAQDRVTVELAGRPAVDSPAAAFPNAYNSQGAFDSKELSLNVCYMIVKEHGGTIVRESLEGGGTRFRISLPAAAERSMPLVVS